MYLNKGDLHILSSLFYLLFIRLDFVNEGALLSAQMVRKHARDTPSRNLSNNLGALDSCSE